MPEYWYYSSNQNDRRKSSPTSINTTLKMVFRCYYYYYYFFFGGGGALEGKARKDGLELIGMYKCYTSIFIFGFIFSNPRYLSKSATENFHQILKLPTHFIACGAVGNEKQHPNLVAKLVILPCPFLQTHALSTATQLPFLAGHTELAPALAVV